MVMMSLNEVNGLVESTLTQPRAPLMAPQAFSMAALVRDDIYDPISGLVISVWSPARPDLRLVSDSVGSVFFCEQKNQKTSQ